MMMNKTKKTQEICEKMTMTTLLLEETSGQQEGVEWKMLSCGSCGTWPSVISPVGSVNFLKRVEGEEKHVDHGETCRSWGNM